MASVLDHDGAAFLSSFWDGEAPAVLADYIAIPNRSPAFDPAWEQAGHMERAVRLLADWARARPIPGLEVEVHRAPGRTPLLTARIPGGDGPPVLVYGHYDKQPEMEGWSEGLGPWKPVRRGEKLYGRGGADDGYALFAALGALEALARAGVRHGPVLVLIEGCEESGSLDLPFWLDRLGPALGQPALVVCLDAGCGDYETLWRTTSLRGLIGGKLTVRVLDEGVHSGDAGGVVPSSFRIARLLLERLEDAATGRIRLAALEAEIPAARRREAEQAALRLGVLCRRRFPWANPPPEGPPEDLTEVVLARTWRPCLEVIGAEGLPPAGTAGNVLRPYTSLALSVRLPPTVDPEGAMAAVEEALRAEPPAGAAIEFERGPLCRGWTAPEPPAWLAAALDRASRAWFGPPPAAMGEGGSIPFLAELGRRFPEAAFFVTGVLGPGSNAHGPDEFLHLETARRLTGCLADVLAAAAAC